MPESCLTIDYGNKAGEPQIQPLRRLSLSRTRSAVFYFAAQTGGRVLSFIAATTIARSLGPTEFGRFSLALSIVSISGVIAELGLDTSLVRDVASDPDGGTRHLRAALLIKLVSSIAVLVALATIRKLITPDAATQTALVILAVSLPLSIPVRSIAAYWMGQRQSTSAATLSVLQIALYGAGAIFFRYQYRSAVGMAAVYTASFGLASVVALASLRSIPSSPQTIRFEVPAILESLKSGLAFFALSVMTIAHYRLGVVILATLTDQKAVGIYVAAYRLVEALLFIPAALMGFLLPILGNSLHHSPAASANICRRILKYLLLAALPIAIVTTFCARPITQMLYAKGWDASIPVLQISVWAWVMICLSGVYATALNARRKTFGVLGIVLFSMTVNVAAGLVLVPRFGGLGTAIAWVLAECTALLSASLLCRSIMPTLGVLPILARPLCAATSMTIALYFFTVFGSPIIVAVSAALGVYLVTLVISPPLDASDRDLLRPVFSDRLVRPFVSLP